MMINELKKIGLAGLGAAALVVEKTGEAVDALAKHGEKTLENTREAREEFSRNISECFKKAEPEIDDIVEKLSQLSEDGLAFIREKISELEVLNAQRAAEQAARETQAHANAINIEFDEAEPAQEEAEASEAPDAAEENAESAVSAENNHAE